MSSIAIKDIGETMMFDRVIQFHRRTKPCKRRNEVGPGH